MSEFDEEAERERLRERFEREERKREATERMSELLLKGATMTNAHCSDCGDPVFRYDGQEFCATCERAIERDADEEATEVTDESDEEGPTNVEVTSPDEDTRVRFGGEDSDDAGADPAEAREEATSPTGGPEAPTANEIESAVEDDDRTLDPDQRPPRPQPTEDAGSAIETARADLAATLQRFARAARESESPTAAREHLRAARAAAETLDELD